MKTKTQNPKIILLILLTLTIFIMGCSNKIDAQNEKILQKILEIEEIPTNKIEIKKETILVSIETSKADEYDTQLISWWGTIFATASILQGDYSFVIIENTVNREPYAYLSTTTHTIQDYEADRINDAQFWDETLITEKKPKTKEITKHTGLPKHTITNKTKTTRTLMIIIIILIIISLTFYLVKKNKIKIPKIKIPKIKTTNITKQIKKIHEEKIKPTTNKTKQKIKQKIKKIHEEKIKPTTNKTKQKIKQKTKKFQERLKQQPK